MLVVAIVIILIIISVGIFMMYRPRPTTESEKPVQVPPTSPVVKPPLQAMIPKSRYPKAKTIKVGKTDLISNWNNRYINLMEVYVYGKDGKNIALKKPIASNTPN
mgnify:FL=1